MESSEQKFFEDLARFGAVTPKTVGNDAPDEPEAEPETPPEPEVQLAKAQAVSYKVPKTKMSTKEKEPEIETEGSLTIDVYQTPSDLVVESAVAGVGPEDIDIEVSTDSVTIRGERHRQHEASDEDYYYQECYWGRFSRSVILPQEIDPESATVNFKNGILTIRLPKLNRRKSRKLKVKLD